MRIESKICDMFGIHHPIFLGGMSGITDAGLVAAVGKAGGMGFIGSGGMSPGVLLKEIQKTRDSIGQYPFGVNLLLKDPDIEQKVDIVVEECVCAVSTGAGNAEKFLSRFKKAGIKVIPVVASLALAERMEALGVDAVIAEGTESGGHVGEATTSIIVSRIADKVSIPVVAAGGIAGTRGLLAVFLLGAEAVQIGTLFLSACEWRIHPNYKSAVIAALDRSTVVTGRAIGRPVRSIKNKLTRQIGKMESQGALAEEIGEKRQGKLRAAVIDGDVSKGLLMCGQAACLIERERSVDDIFNNLLNPIWQVLRTRLLRRLPPDQS